GPIPPLRHGPESITFSSQKEFGDRGPTLPSTLDPDRCPDFPPSAIWHHKRSNWHPRKNRAPALPGRAGYARLIGAPLLWVGLYPSSPPVEPARKCLPAADFREACPALGSGS